MYDAGITVDDATQLRDMQQLSGKEAREVAAWTLNDTRDDVLNCSKARQLLGSEIPASGAKQQ